jgi:hypothetical protein
MIKIILIAATLSQSGPPIYPEYGPDYDLRLPLECSYYPNAPCIIVAPREDPVEKAQREYRERQDRFQCAQHPEKCGFKK